MSDDERAVLDALLAAGFKDADQEDIAEVTKAYPAFREMADRICAFRQADNESSALIFVLPEGRSEEEADARD